MKQHKSFSKMVLDDAGALLPVDREEGRNQDKHVHGRNEEKRKDTTFTYTKK